MDTFYEPLLQLETFVQAGEKLTGNEGLLLLTGCVESQKTHLMYSLGRGWQVKLILTYSELKAKEIYEEYEALGEEAFYYPAKDFLFFHADIQGNELLKQRMTAVSRLLSGKAAVIVTTLDGCMDPLLPFEKLKELVLTIGTGIGGCIIADGKVFHGFSNSACEVGYMHMAGSDFQTLGAASILTRKVAEWKNEPAEVWNGYHIFEEAKKGDGLCVRAIEEMADVLGQGIANICYVINPEAVVLGGGIMAQEEYLRPLMERALEKYLIPSICSRTRIAFAKHRNDAGMLGAFYHFMQRRSV